MKFFRNKDNKDYLIIQLSEYLEYIFAYGQPKVEESLEYDKIVKVICNCNFLVNSQIAIHKDTLLGEFLLTNTDGVNIIDEDKLITEEKIQNALLIAVYDNIDFKLLNKIEMIFRERITGTIEELEQKGYDRRILQIIAETEDIKTHIRKKENKYVPQNFIVFEEKEMMYKNLLNGDCQYQKKL